MRAAAATPPRPAGWPGTREKRVDVYLQRSVQHQRGLPADRSPSIRNTPTRYSSSSSSPSSTSSSGKKTAKLRRKYYRVVASDPEKTEAKSLRSITRKRLISYTKPPGYRMFSEGDPTNPKFPEIRGYGRKIFKAIATFVRTLHGKRLTMNGNIKAGMLLWIASSKCIKLRNVSPDTFSEFTTEGREKDYDAIADVIEDDLLRGFKLPEDLKDWLKLMRANPLKNRYLIRCHVALMAPKAKVDHFLFLYGRLMQEQKLSARQVPGSKNKHKAVVDNMPVGDTSREHSWRSDVARNEYVEKIYNYRREGYPDNSGGLLKLARDCTQHLLDHSVKLNKIEFGSKHIYMMLESCFNGLFYQFQIAMFQAGFKDHSLKETM